MDIKVKEFRGYSEELLQILCSLENAIIDQPYSEEKIKRECGAKHQLLSLIAYSGDEPVGYKVGYEMTSRLFLSWMGGVLPEYRSQGTARKLMSKQHSMAKDIGYKVVRTYTENQFNAHYS